MNDPRGAARSGGTRCCAERRLGRGWLVAATIFAGHSASPCRPGASHSADYAPGRDFARSTGELSPLLQPAIGLVAYLIQVSRR
jgi:hypothetical protein